jgi:hypothetical protein
MTYADLKIMNESFGGLADTLLRNRQMAQQEKDRTAERSDRASEHSDEMAYRNRELDQRASEQKSRHQELVETLKRNTIKFHEGQMKEITDMVADGSLTPEQGTQMLKGGAAKIDQWEKDESPVIAAFASPDFKLQKTQDDSQPVEAKVGGRKIIYSKKTGRWDFSDNTVDTGKERNAFLEKILSDKEMTPEQQARAVQTWDAQQKISRPSAPAESSHGQSAASASSKYDIQVVSPGEGGQAAPEAAPVAAPSSAAPPVTPQAAPLSGSPVAPTPPVNQFQTGIPEIDNAVQKELSATLALTEKQQSESAARTKKQQSDALANQIALLQKEIDENVGRQKQEGMNPTEAEAFYRSQPSSGLYRTGSTALERAKRIKAAQAKLAALKAANPWSNPNADLSSQ